MSGQHAPIAPSALAQTVQCPGSVSMQARYPEADGPEAAEGEVAHWVAAGLASSGFSALGEIAPNGVVITDEMLDGAELLAGHIDKLRSAVGVPVVEFPVQIPRIHPQCWGTPDVRLWSAPRHLHVIDYKFGHGFVEVVENWQLMAYATGLIDDRLDNDDRTVTVSLTIVQPRSYHRDGPVRTWTINGADLRPFINIASGAAHEALGDAPKLRTGPQCKHCTARHACPANQAAGLDIVDTVGRAVPLDLPTREAANELRRLDYAAEQLEARRTGLQAQLLAAARAGEQVPFYHVEHGSGREGWSVPVPQVLALGGMYGVDLAKPQAVTPAQARKLGVDVDGMTARGAGAATLKLDSPYANARIFGGHRG